MVKTNYTKTVKGFSFSTFTRCFSLALIFGALSISGLNAQTQVFLDQFNAGYGSTTTMTLPSTEGTPAIIHNKFATSGGTIAAGDFKYSYKNSTNMFLQIGANAVAGSSFIYFDNSGYLSPYSASAGLKATSGLITWYVNLKTYNTHATNYRSAVVLGCSNSDFNNATATGYAVYCSKSTAGKISLARFSAGVLGASVTDVIAESTTYTANDYLSIKVTYDPATDNWSLFVRNDGPGATGAFTLPWTGTLTQQGTATTNATYTAAADNLKYSGYYFKHSNGATSSYKTLFDNFKVIVDAPTLTASSSTLTGLNYSSGSGPSTSQSFNLSGTYLTGAPGNITVAGTTNYEVSTDNTNFGSSVNVAYSSATLASTPVYVRLKSGLPIASYNSEVVTCTGGGAAAALNVTCSGRVLQSPVTYTWNQTGTASVATAANWTPERTTPEINDILVFNGGGTVVATDLTTQTIGQLLISNSTTVELQSAAAATLTIAGEAGVDLSVGAGSALNIAQATNAITVAVGTGATGSIAGTMTYSTAAHRLTAANASGITFQTGSSFTEGTAFSGNPFGTTSLNSVVFSNGSTFNYVAGSNPFGATAPSSVVVFQTGSNYIHKATGSPSASGRTYANFELNAVGTASSTGSSALTVDNITVTAGTLSLGMTTATTTINGTISVANGATLNLNPLTAGTISLKGDITIASGGILTVNPTETEAITFNGTSAQTINNAGTFTSAAGTSYIVDNTAGLNLASNVSLPTLTINAGKVLNVNAGKQLSAGTTLVNNGTLNLLSSDSGTATILTPASITGTGTYKVQQYLTNQSWYLTSPMTGTVTPTNLSRIQGYNEGVGNGNDWSASGTTMEAWKGYITSVSSAPNTVEFTGTINSGNISIPLTRQAATDANKYGFNLIGNPYTAYLDWNAVATANVAKMPTATMWYRTKVSGGWDFTTVNGMIATPNNASYLIPPMQAFWVRASGTGNTTLDLTNAMVLPDNNSTNKLKAPAVANAERQMVRLQVSNTTNTDELVIYTDAQALNSFDTFDSPKMSNENVDKAEISCVVGTEHLVINGLNSLNLDTALPIRFMTKKANAFTFKANQVSNLPEGVKVILNDNGAEFDLTSGAEYNFTSDVADNTNRFSVIFRSSGVATAIGKDNFDNMPLTVYKNQNNQIAIQRTVSQNATVTVCNAIGQKLFSTQMTGSSMVIDKAFDAGVYFVNLSIAGNKTTKKVIIN